MVSFHKIQNNCRIVNPKLQLTRRQQATKNSGEGGGVRQINRHQVMRGEETGGWTAETNHRR